MAELHIERGAAGTTIVMISYPVPPAAVSARREEITTPPHPPGSLIRAAAGFGRSPSCLVRVRRPGELGDGERSALGVVTHHIVDRLSWRVG